MNAYEALRPLLEPRSVVVVGISRSGKQGAVFLQGLLDPGFKGNLYVVNPAADEIMGVKAYPSIAALPETPDLAVLTLPSEASIQVVAECAARGVPGAAMFTAGFDELGTEEGRERGRRLMAAAAGRVRLIGPNGMGVYNPRRGIAFFPGMASAAGGLGLISQSGSLAQFAVHAAVNRGLAFSKAVSMGNQIDLNAADYLEYFAADPETRAICAYIEGVPDGRRFRRALEQAAAAKPVVIWKSGRVAAGARAARSHTGQLAGDYAIWQAMARQAGAVLVRELEEMIDTVTAAMAFAGASARGRRIAIMTGPGGPAVSASDACEEAGLELATLSPATTEALREIIAPAGTSVNNPVDVGMVLQGAAEFYGRCLRLALADENVDAAVVIGGERGNMEGFARMLADVRRESSKPVMYALSDDFGPNPTTPLLAQGDVATAPSAERCLRAYARLAVR
ncbi:MAG: CoA-binding protein [Thermoflexaceae bacterium]|nr:CoA-binding protein [Thermoflexaceae bacterium]